MRWKLTAKFNTRSTNRKCCTPQSHPNLCINTVIHNNVSNCEKMEAKCVWFR